MLIIPFWYGIL
ncbi:hypothetical protein VCHENC02_5248, partial [Vibrio harveyi]